MCVSEPRVHVHTASSRCGWLSSTIKLSHGEDTRVKCLTCRPLISCCENVTKEDLKSRVWLLMNSLTSVEMANDICRTGTRPLQTCYDKCTRTRLGWRKSIIFRCVFSFVGRQRRISVMTACGAGHRKWKTLSRFSKSLTPRTITAQVITLQISGWVMYVDRPKKPRGEDVGSKMSLPLLDTLDN